MDMVQPGVARTGVTSLSLDERQDGHVDDRVRDGGRVQDMLRGAGLRPTRQRVSLAALLFGEQHRHVSAEQLAEEAARAGIPVSLATIYNTLHQFTEAGLLREVAIDGTRTYFDTNTGDHQHFFIEGHNEVVDIDAADITIDGLPTPPEGMEISRVDVIVRLRRKAD